MSLATEVDFSPCQGKKNLLAFSAGVDSTALFFLLLEKNISFDIALVNYNLRKGSKDELLYAQTLADRYDKTLYHLETTLNDSHIEEQARKIRFDFFESLIKEHGYQFLLTAHQLNDQLEWFLMQLSKGAGSLELVGMQNLDIRTHYTLFKPLLHLSKEQLQAYLDSSKKHYFIDESNQDESYKRNYFRHHFSDKLIHEFQKGISRSFDYIQEDNSLLLKHTKIKEMGELTLIHSPHTRVQLYYIDKDLKKRGYILSHAQRLEIQKNNSLVISNRFVIEIVDTLVYITPSLTIPMEKSFKESCRLAHLPKKIRPFLYQEKMDIGSFKQELLEWLS